MSGLTTNARSRGADVARGLLSLVGVAVLVAGVPAALATWVGSPLPAGVPALSDITGALSDSHIPDELLVKALALVCWLVWIELVASLLVEAVAHVRGRRAGSVPLAGGLQRGAARLVAGVALLGAVAATRGLPAPGPAPSALVPATAPAITLATDAGEASGAAGGEVAPPRPSATAAPELPTYDVQRRDTLWDIAERHLDDPFRWREIFEINEGCPQSDGRCLTDPDVIHPGWRLQLPADAVGLAAPASPDGPAAGATREPTSPPGSGAQPGPITIDGGMVLIGDEGSAGDEPQVGVDAVGPAAGGGFGGAGGMVLLPDGPAVGDPGAPLVAGGDGENELAGRQRDDR